MQQPARGKTDFEAFEQLGGQTAFVLPHRFGRPLRAIHIINRHECRLAAHRQTHVARFEIGLHLPAQGIDGLPLLVGIRLGHPRLFLDPGHGHGKVKLHFRHAGGAGNRGRTRRLRRTRQRNVPLTGKQARCGIESHPPRPRQINFRPGVQIGKILPRTGWPNKGFFVRHELNEIAGYKPGSQSHMPQKLHQEPGAIAARSPVQR